MGSCRVTDQFCCVWVLPETCKTWLVVYEDTYHAKNIYFFFLGQVLLRTNLICVSRPWDLRNRLGRVSWHLSHWTWVFLIFGHVLQRTIFFFVWVFSETCGTALVVHENITSWEHHIYTPPHMCRYQRSCIDCTLISIHSYVIIYMYDVCGTCSCVMDVAHVYSTCVCNTLQHTHSYVIVYMYDVCGTCSCMMYVAHVVVWCMWHIIM